MSENPSRPQGPSGDQTTTGPGAEAHRQLPGAGAVKGHHTGWMMPIGTSVLFVEGCLLATVIWKETPVFWRNEGGYPVWVRSVVLLGFYPTLLAAIASVLFFTAGCIREYRSTRRVAPSHLAIGIGMWLLLAGVFVLLLANNLANLADGRPFHWHDR